jgi:4-amino-4-deoxy-L-arabinose transferase-like glycosyltransferase
MSFPRDRGWLPGILLLAAALRLYGIGHSLPFVYNPDEANILARALSVARSLDPQYYLYPSFFFYFLFAVMGGLFVVGKLVGRYDSLSAFEARFFEDPSDFYLAGRVAVVLLALASIVLLERLASKHFGKTAGRAAAFFMAVAYVHARDSHYIKHDVPAGFLVVLFLWACDRAVSRKDLSAYLLAGAVLGVGFATHYYLIFLAPAFLIVHLASGGREGLSRVAAAAAVSAVTFFLLSPFVILRLPTALEHMRANRQVVLDRSLGQGTGLFPSLGLYVEFLLGQGLGYVLTGLVLAGLFSIARKDARGLALWAAFPVMFLAFLSYTFFAGRYLNPILPCLAAAAGVAVSSIAARFGPAAAVVTAVAAAVQPLYLTLQVDRLFASTDTRTLARDWAIEKLSPGTTVALQSYSAPLPQSKESFVESLEANGALSELERKGKYAHLLRVAESETTSFRLFFLGKGDEPNRIYVGYDSLVESLAPLRALGVKAIVLRHPPTPPPPELGALFERVGKEGELLASLSPFRGASAIPYLDNEDWPPSASLAHKGPLVQVWSLEDP